MKDSKLVRALNTLNKEEWISFRKHLLMYTGVESEIYALFSKLQARKQNLSGLKSPEKFRAKNFPALSQTAFFAMQSKLYKWFEEWLSVYEMKQTEYESKLYLIKALFRKGLIKDARSNAVKLKKEINASVGLSFKTNKILGEIDHLLYYQIGKESAEKRHQLLISICEKNAFAYKERSQFYIAELINRARVLKTDFSTTQEMLESSCKFIGDTNVSDMGYSVVELITDQKEEQLHGLYSSMKEKKFKSELEDLLITYLFIYARKMHARDKKVNSNLILSILNYRLHFDTNKKGEKISQTSFHNFVDTVANFISFEKAKEFVDHWIDFVETSSPKETKDLAYSQIYFINRDFEQMIKYSSFNGFDNYGQKTRAWLHNVICQFVFRKENYNLTIQSLRSFKNYLKRNKRKYSKNFFLSNFNHASILEKLVKNDFKPQEINLEDYMVIFYRKWISEELEKIKKK